MNVLDQQNGSVHGLSLFKGSVSADQKGVGIDLSQGDKVGHVHLAINNLQSTLTVNLQESNDDVDADYATTTTWSIGLEGDLGTGEITGNPACHILQFIRTKPWARVQIVVGSNVSIGFSAILSSMLQSAGGGVDRYPAA